MKNLSWNRWKSVVLAGALAALATPSPAGMIATDRAVAASERERVREFVSRDDVAAQLQALGIAPETARQRVDAMNDEEIQTVAGRMDTLAAGGALDKMDWILVLLVVVLLLVVL